MAQFVGPIHMLTPDVPAISNMTGDIPMFSWQRCANIYTDYIKLAVKQKSESQQPWACPKISHQYRQSYWSIITCPYSSRPAIGLGIPPGRDQIWRQSTGCTKGPEANRDVLFAAESWKPQKDIEKPALSEIYVFDLFGGYMGLLFGALNIRKQPCQILWSSGLGG